MAWSSTPLVNAGELIKASKQTEIREGLMGRWAEAITAICNYGNILVDPELDDVSAGGVLRGITRMRTLVADLVDGDDPPLTTWFVAPVGDKFKRYTFDTPAGHELDLWVEALGVGHTTWHHPITVPCNATHHNDFQALMKKMTQIQCHGDAAYDDPGAPNDYGDNWDEDAAWATAKADGFGNLPSVRSWDTWDATQVLPYFGVAAYALKYDTGSGYSYVVATAYYKENIIDFETRLLTETIAAAYVLIATEDTPDADFDFQVSVGGFAAGPVQNSGTPAFSVGAMQYWHVPVNPAALKQDNIGHGAGDTRVTITYGEDVTDVLAITQPPDTSTTTYFSRCWTEYMATWLILTFAFD